MGDLQATLEFMVQLHRFFNVDLFQRGFYQVRASLKVPPKLPAKVEVSLPKNSSCSLVFPACVVNGTAVSKTFQILYKNEEVFLDDIISFKTHILLEGHKVRDSLVKAGIQLVLELWFTDQHFGPDHHSSIQCVSTRVLQLHFDPSRGLHHHLPVMFDYFHLSVVTVTIHSTLLALCQPYLSLQKAPKTPFASSSPRLSSKKAHFSSLEMLFFGNQHIGRALPQSTRIHRGRLVHWELCSLLLAAHAGLRRKLSEYMKLLPPWQQLKIDSTECLNNLEGLSELAKECQKLIDKTSNTPSSSTCSLNAKDPLAFYNNATLKSILNSCQDEEELLVSANSDIAQLCGALVVLWQQFLEIVLGREKVLEHLAKQHHHQRVKRFSEAFFLIERPRESATHPCETGMMIYQDVTEELRRSNYLNSLPPLEVESLDLDGDCNTLPIIYEEHYQETARRASLSRSSHSTVSLCDVGFMLEESKSSKDSSRSSRARSESQSSAELRANNKSEEARKVRSPSIVSLSDDSPVFSPVSKTPFTSSSTSNVYSFQQQCGSGTGMNKTSLREKFLNSLKFDIDYEREEYSVTPSSKRHGKMALRSKIKIRARTANFLKQFRKGSSCQYARHHHHHHHQNGNSVVLLGFKKIENTKISASCHERLCKVQPLFEVGMRHSLSTLSVVGTLSYIGDRQSSLQSSESMPDLSSTIPPPPPPPRSRFLSSELGYACNGQLDSSNVNVNQAFERQIARACSEFMLQPCPGIHGGSTSSLAILRDKLSNKNQAEGNGKNNAGANKKGSKKLRSSSLGRADVNHKVQFLNKTRNPPVAAQIAEPSHIYEEICPPSPPQQFRDEPKRNSAPEKPKTQPPTSLPKSDSQEMKAVPPPPRKSPLPSPKPKSTSRSPSSTSEPGVEKFEECQGTMFFPKPPPEFSEDASKAAAADIEKDEKEKEPSVVEIAEEAKPKPEEINIFPADVIRHQPVKDNTIIPPPKSMLSQCEIDRVRADFDKPRSQSVERPKKSKHVRRMSYFERKCTILEMLTDVSTSDPDDYYRPAYCNGSPPEHYKSNSSSVSNCDHHQRSQSLATTSLWDNTLDENSPSLRRISAIGAEMISFVKAKEEFRQQLGYPWLWYSDFPTLASVVPYFQCDNDLRAFSPEGLHLIVCVHGLDGNSADLRLVRTYLELGLPTANFEFLMSERNQGETFDDFETMTDRLVSEITYHVEVYGLNPSRISFIGHSLGNIIIRSALARPEMKPFLGLLHTFMSLSGPHLGTLYNNSGLVNMGMWFMQKWKKSGSLLQLAMKDSLDPKNTFLYKLSKKPGLEFFRNVLLFGSSQDRYVPIHSARIELCKAAVKDNSSQGNCYREMVSNLLQPIIKRPDVHFVRYDIHHALPSSANTLIGRAAHIAVLDSELFIEKFMVVCGLKYFA